MVFYSLDYSMSNFEQAKARIHRAGQKENCHYIYLVCRGTVDRKVLYALRQMIAHFIFSILKYVGVCFQCDFRFGLVLRGYTGRILRIMNDTLHHCVHIMTSI